MKKGNLFIISGFSGAGKGTVVKGVINRQPEIFLSISATTREKRDFEFDGRDYFFVSEEEFEKMIEKDELYEYTSYLNNYYGTPKGHVREKLRQGYNVILEIEMQGAMQIKKIEESAILIFIVPPNAEVLKTRLKNRNTESDELITKRLKKSFSEVEEIKHYDYLVLNDRLEICIEDVLSIIRSEGLKNTNKKSVINKFKKQFKEIIKEEI